MDYHEAANALLGLRRYPIGEGIESTADLLAHLGDPHEGLTCVQVAGSNGKGTTARMVERTLREAGLSVGLYTSPHFDDVRERVRVDGTPTRKGAVTEFVAAVEDHVTERGAAGEAPTFFETLTAMALWEFDRRGVDVAVLEVGIGGRYDATSVVDPVASAVTSVTLEHTDVLGDTVEEIARDKAQVAPEDGVLVTATAGEALAAIREEAGPLLTVGESEDSDVRVEYGGRRNHAEADVAVAGENWRVETSIPVLGEHQARNAGVAAALARATAAAVDADLDEATVARGLRGAHWPGRFEVLGTDPVVVLDGAHNPGACETLAATLSEFEYDDLHLAFGALVDKDHAGMAAALPDAGSVVTAAPDLDRAEAPETLARAFEDAGAGAVRTAESVEAALSEALASATAADCVLVTGSLHTVAEARRRWTRTEVPRRVRSLAEGETVLRDADVDPQTRARTRESTVHRVVRTRLQPRQATRVRAELLSVGGECAVSGVEDDRELREVVLSATVGQFRRLATALDGAPHGLSSVADELRAAVGIDGPSATRRPAVADAGSGFEWLEDTTVMGILNVTPDSFHDGGEYDAVDAAVDRARKMVAAGVGVLDVGGESTRPGAEPVSPEEERERVVPVIEAIRGAGIEVPISVDTRKASVADAALAAGADVVNDVSGLEDPEMRFVAADHDAGLVVMHSVETPVDPDSDPEYDDVVTDVLDDLRERVLLAERAGVPRERVIVDPGLGFGKSAAESFALLDRIDEFRALGCPVLVGHSHKSMFGAIGADHGERLAPTVAATALAADRGADLVRVHDPVENVAAVRTALAARDPERFGE